MLITKLRVFGSFKLFTKFRKGYNKQIKRRLHVKKEDFITLTKFVIARQKLIPHASGEFTQLLNSIQTAVKIVDIAVRKAGLTELFGMHGTTNVHNEEVKKLDVLANDIFINLLSSSYAASIMVSEENENAVEVKRDMRGKYSIAFDPLDGSSNIDCLVSIGSIFGIYRNDVVDVPSVKHILHPGRALVAAGYALYGSATVIVFTTGKGVNIFMLDHAIGEFLLTDENVKIPQKGNIYSINEGYYHMWDDAVKEYVTAKKDPAKGKPYSQRYVGSMVADVHRTIKYGGIFMYPATDKTPQGKLRLLYECNPMAYIIEQAGGAATDGTKPILDIVPQQIHHRTPIFMGSKDDVEEFLSYVKKYPNQKR